MHTKRNQTGINQERLNRVQSYLNINKCICIHFIQSFKEIIFRIRSKIRFKEIIFDYHPIIKLKCGFSFFHFELRFDYVDFRLKYIGLGLEYVGFELQCIELDQVV